MLIFNRNIYAPRDKSSSLFYENEDGPNWGLDPYNFLLTALTSDRQLFIGLDHLEEPEKTQRLKAIFPHSSRFGTLEILNSISKRLLEALVNHSYWYKMNAYHYCYLYDTLYSLVEEYSYEKPEQRMEIFPELMGGPIHLNDFLLEYIGDTAFLIHPDRFNNLTAEEKKQMNLVDPCLFGVINKLTPTEEEINLPSQTEDPYEQ